jgi:hypothetical protein
MRDPEISMSAGWISRVKTLTSRQFRTTRSAEFGAEPAGRAVRRRERFV